ncbi:MULTISPECIES: thiamine phosphate synthase [unclassified Herbaspirillum]|uniref:thiamine phosphate synthase n=1 Tax=unclassified Herbaspirillum TaxID=2624150 RepID=UPI001153C111|nr:MULTISPECIES: thiamine phosphate synthase [unclassified Herbaspirillum]MBB5392592.1 thiamine-phosphate pyrophosphorylase [Herbaspirillum sp. SJZ102]TQK06229.1 thiamine-phosphate diphosphorylase [Herbaspirillum sp. SJZ130]TQK12293.1 thiamine-phosphate diphosphorylase [Herbaspirillum sp. SJZ106]TWC68433.1 thiamine-phosphate diphosphorylase [Herbaspirillum sp. SJZ099]
MDHTDKQWHVRGLYIVTPDWDDTEQLVSATEQAIRGGAALVQYRHKNADEVLRREQASALLHVCRRHNTPFIVNDHVELCLALDADGIHVGGTDASVAEVRARVGRDKIVGASCYGTLQLARDAHAAGASYVAFGGFYPSRVKKYAFKTAPEIVAESKREIPLPVVVIGGMTQENCLPLIAQGADMVAAISSVYMAPQDAQAAARGFAGLF